MSEHTFATIQFVQRSLDDLGTPLSDVTFVVLDLETTGGSPTQCEITEVGAVKYRGGECLGTFQTLVNPGRPIPAEIVYVTGITDLMVTPAPPIEAVLPQLLEFVRDAVIVGHNVRFDLGFIQEKLRRAGYPKLQNNVVDTCALARRLVRDEVPNCTLTTLSRYFRTVTHPCHRALADAKATAEVLHALLERAGTLGVVALDDLLALPRTAAHPQVAKLRWVAQLPRRPGVYVFRDIAGRPLYVGKAVDLRRRVRSYFGGDDRRKIGPLLREAHSLDHVVCAHELHAEVLEVRMIQELRPRYNRKDKNPATSVFVKLSLAEQFPRLSVARVRRLADGNLYVGPLPSQRLAKQVIEAVESAIPLRRCAARPKTVSRDFPCAPAQLRVAACPCSGHTGSDAYDVIVQRSVAALTTEPALVLDPIHDRMRRLAEAGRFEEAAAARDRAGAFVRAVERQRRLDAILGSGRIEIELDGGGGAIVDNGRLTAAWPAGSPPPAPELGFWPPGSALVSKETAAEALVIASWLDRRASSARLVACEGELAWPAGRLPRFAPARVA